MNTLLLSCMDLRLNGILDNENDGSTIMLRNAGANANALYSSIKSIISGNVGKIKLMAHNDCGAMKVAYNALKDHGEVGDSIEENLVKQFNGKEFNSIDELEKLNEQVQMGSLKGMSNGIDVESSFVDLSNYHFDESVEDIVAFTYSSKERYEDICKKAGLDVNATYFIQADSIEEVYADIEIAVTRLGIKRIAAIATKPLEYRPVYADMQKLKMKDFAKDAQIQFIKL